MTKTLKIDIILFAAIAAAKFTQGLIGKYLEPSRGIETSCEKYTRLF